MKKFDSTFIASPYQSRIDTDPNRNAEFLELLRHDMVRDTIGSDRYLRWGVINAFSREIAVVYYIMCISGCRISEVLDIRGNDVINAHQIVIRGKKRSGSRIINVSAYSRLFGAHIGRGSSHVFYLNYDQVYRVFKKVGIADRKKGNKNKSVCHLPRYQYIESVYKSGQSQKVVQEVIGHKSAKSTAHYLDRL